MDEKDYENIILNSISFTIAIHVGKIILKSLCNVENYEDICSELQDQILMDRKGFGFNSIK